ncbi:hypothetical protein KOI35_27560 [Actinoplanes bogorensis]|uniref:Twin-arginine translocation signal domain-containing protein n=1 Tax=Paractinoplanes bogorensis TaxID=1610840 RepID=A0ABS5YUZ9_9ACTN|nr:hypothetical protein [Actinoplanes bogorensis]MBU2667273.1 hypothetical protein [Actinoplanes bogorensis]
MTTPVSRRGFVTGTAATAAVAAGYAVLPAAAADPALAASRRSSAVLVPGSKHFATMLAFGDFVISTEGKLLFSKPEEVGPSKDPNEVIIACAGIQGLSGVVTDTEVETVDGRPRVGARRILTHFQWDNPSVEIEQNPYRTSDGFLWGDEEGGVEALLPGKASFHQYLILTAYGRPLINVQPMTMTAESVTAWPPVGSTFRTEGPTDFYDLSSLERPNDMASDLVPGATKVATLAACAAEVMSQVFVPSVEGVKVPRVG